MSYRNYTEVIVEDPHRPSRNRYVPAHTRYEPSSYISDRPGFWEVMWDKSKDFALLLAGAVLMIGIINVMNWVDDKYSICAKAKAYISGESKEATKSKTATHYERGLQGEKTLPPTALTITCCECNSFLDASAYGHLSSFSCVCPMCGTSLYVEKIN